jgi:LPXTG-motif cell wall-anchored protein
MAVLPAIVIVLVALLVLAMGGYLLVKRRRT